MLEARVATRAPETKHVLRVADLTTLELGELLELSLAMKKEGGSVSPALPGGAVACLFEKPSTRTRVSFEVAAHRLGMLPVMLRPDELQLGRGETVADTARTLSGYVNAIVIRANSHGMLVEVATHATVPVINALSDLHHPCQALADAMTLMEHFGRSNGLKLVYVGDANNVAHSLMEIGGLLGMHVVIACPDRYRPDPTIEANAADLARKTGGSVRVMSDPFEAVIGADAIYSDVFVSMGQDSEAVERLRAFSRYRVTRTLMKASEKSPIFMHCLPAHRGVEVDADVIDGPGSVVWQQAENRMHTEQALLSYLVAGR